MKTITRLVFFFLVGLSLAHSVEQSEFIAHLKKRSGTSCAVNKNGDFTDIWTERGLTDADVRNASTFPHLKALCIVNCEITDQAIEALAGHEALLELVLINSVIGDQAVEHIAKIPNIQSLNLSGTKISKASFKFFAKMKNLNYLDITKTKIDEASVDELRKQLPHVHIYSGPIQEGDPVPPKKP